MARPRSTDKHQPLTISVPASMMKRLDQEISYKQSRSKWVQQAIKAKLDAHEDKSQVISSISNLQLLGILFSREIINLDLFTSLRKQVEETEEGQ